MASSKKALNEIAYRHLRTMIYNCELEQGKIYSETRLAADLSISRTPMRDALNRLAQERYIDILPSIGFQLHVPTHSDIMEAYHVRRMIEEYCSQIVAKEYPAPAAKATVERMRQALASQKIIVQDPAAYSLPQFWQEDLTFHKAALNFMNISALNLQYESFMHIFMPHHLIANATAQEVDPYAMERHLATLREHQKIIDALTSGDIARTKQAIRAHLDSSLAALKYTEM